MVQLKLQINPDPRFSSIEIKEGLAMYLEPIGVAHFENIEWKEDMQKINVYVDVDAPDGSKLKIEKAIHFYVKCYSDIKVLSVTETLPVQTSFNDKGAI